MDLLHRHSKWELWSDILMAPRMSILENLESLSLTQFSVCAIILR